MSINTISELVKEISSSKKEEIENLINNLAIPLSEFEKIGTWDENYYTRNCIARTEDYELLLLCWQAGQETPIHCHNDQDCWVFLIEGAITEKKVTYDFERLMDDAILMSCSEFGDAMIENM